MPSSEECQSKVPLDFMIPSWISRFPPSRRRILAPTPLFMLLLFGTGAACLVLMIYAALHLQDPGSKYQLIAGALYIVGVVLVTVGYHVPRNNMLERPRSEQCRWDRLLGDLPRGVGEDEPRAHDRPARGGRPAHVLAASGMTTRNRRSVLCPIRQPNSTRMTSVSASSGNRAGASSCMMDERIRPASRRGRGHGAGRPHGTDRRL